MKDGARNVDRLGALVRAGLPRSWLDSSMDPRLYRRCHENTWANAPGTWKKTKARAVLVTIARRWTNT